LPKGSQVGSVAQTAQQGVPHNYRPSKRLNEAVE